MRAARSSGLVAVAIVCGLAVLTFAVYGQVRHHEFVDIDDPIYIVDNPNLRDAVSAESLWRAFAQPYETNWIPLTWISLQLDYALFGLQPAGYHLENVALHALSACLLYLALFQMTGSHWRSAWVAAVFAVHPLHVESIAWASERKDALCGAFWMLSLVAYVSYCRKPDSVVRYLILATGFALALLAKPMAVTFPVLMLLLDFWPLSRLSANGSLGWPDPARLRRALVEKLPLVAIAAAVGVVTVVVQSNAGAVLRGDLLSLPLRAMNAVNSLDAYLADSFWPTNLSVFYPHAMGKASGSLAIAQTAALVAISGLLAWLSRTRPSWMIGWLWFLIALAPVIGFVQVGLQARADRYTYLPQIGLTIALAWGIPDPLGRGGRRALAAAGAASVAALAIAGHQQVSHWRSTTTLYEHAVAVDADSPMAHLGLAGLRERAGRVEEAEDLYRRAIEISPGLSGAHAGLADLHAREGRLDLAIEGYRRALRKHPRRARWRAHLGKALAEAGQPRAAIPELELAIQLYGDAATPEVHAYLAVALALDAQLDRARSEYQTAIRLRPDYADAHRNLGFVLARMGRNAEAVEHLERALEIAGESAEIHAGLGDACVQLGAADRAIGHYRAAIRLRPDWAQPTNNLAWILATHPDPRIRDPNEALRLALRLGASPASGPPGYLDTLAAAQAAAGDFEAARANAGAAARLARERGDASVAREIDARSDAYRNRRPFIEQPIRE